MTFSARYAASIALVAMAATLSAHAASLRPDAGPAPPATQFTLEQVATGSSAFMPQVAAEAASGKLDANGLANDQAIDQAIDAAAPSGGGDVGKPVDDLSFLALAADRGRQERDIAHDALGRLQDPRLKQLAAALVHDHGEANARMEQIAHDKRWPLPAMQQPPAPPTGMASADFDAAWTDDMVAAHERLAALYGAQAQGGEDPDLRRYARETLPTLQHHLAELRRMQK